MDNNISMISEGAATAMLEDLVCAAFAHGSDQARAYCQVLQDGGITALLGEEMNGAAGSRISAGAVPILVPASYLEHAAELLAVFEVENADWDGDDEFEEEDDDLGDDDDDFFDDDDDDDFDDDDDDDDDEFEVFDDED